jgi:hypothetical protein
MPKITVVTVTNRFGGIDIWKSNLQKQTFEDFEAILIDEHYECRSQEVGNYVGHDRRFIHSPAPLKEEGKFYNLSKCMNWGAARGKGELVVYYQDYIWLDPRTLERFWRKYGELGDVLLTGVGHKARFPDWAVNLGGLITIFTQSGFPIDVGPHDRAVFGVEKPQGVWFRDPRIQGRGLVLCNPIEWEADVCAVPKCVLERLGGFDEDFDAGRCYDNVNFAERAQVAGIPIWLDEENEHLGYSHELLFDLVEHGVLKTAPNNAKLWESKLERLQRGELPYRVPYLDYAHRVLLAVGK